jgi:hypothetical protein
VAREDFEASLSTLEAEASTESNVISEANSKVTGNVVLDILKNKGRVYGVYQAKELVGIYIYERIEDFFLKVENENSDGKKDTSFKVKDVKKFFEMTDEDVSDFEDQLWGESKAIYRLVSKHLSSAAEEYRDEIEKYIVADLKSQIEWGQIAGALNGEKLIYRRNLDKKGLGAAGYGLGYGARFTIGVIFGWLAFGSMSMSLMWGVCFGAVGSLIFTTSATKQEWITFDFVNKKYVENGEDR